MFLRDGVSIEMIYTKEPCECEQRLWIVFVSSVDNLLLM
jgi:hypothetical protein